MSFILDALRKSEHERQQKTGPGLAEIPAAPRKPKSNVWATAVVALLIVNLVAIGVLMLRRSSHTDSGEAAATSTPAATTAATPASTPAPTQPAVEEPSTVPEAQPQPTLRTSPPPAVAPGRNPLEAEVSGGAQDIDAGIAASAASVPAGPPAVTRASPGAAATAGGVTTIGGGGGSVRYEPIPQSVVERAIAAESRTTAPTPAPAAPRPAPAEAALPSADEITASGGVPSLHLDLHVYSTRPAERFVFVNSHKYREGDTMQEGPTVEQITPTGAVLTYRGSRFLLSH